MPEHSSILQLCPHTEDIASLALISPQSQSYFISVHSPNLILYWKLGKTGPAARLEGHNSSVSAVAFGFEETIIASGSEAGTVMLWDIAGQRALSSLKGNRSAVTSLSMGKEGSSGLLAAAGADGLVRLWDSRAKDSVAIVATHSGAANCVEFSPSSDWIASGSADGSICLWDLNTQRTLHELHMSSAASTRLLTFSPQQTVLACAGLSCVVNCWDLTSFETVYEGNLGSGQIQGMDFDPHDQFLFVATKSELSAVDSQTWEEAARLEGGLREVMDICSSVSGVVSVSAVENRVEVWTTDVSEVGKPSRDRDKEIAVERTEAPGVSTDSEEQLKALGDVSSNHSVYMELFRKKKESLSTVLQWWTESNVNATIGSLSMLKDVPVSADVLKAWIIDSSAELVIIDHLPLLLPLCLKLIESKYESFIRVGLSATHTLVEKFDAVLMNGLQDGGQREDLYRKCEVSLGCFTQILNAQAFIKSLGRKNKVKCSQVGSQARKLGEALEMLVWACRRRPMAD